MFKRPVKNIGGLSTQVLRIDGYWGIFVMVIFGEVLLTTEGRFQDVYL